MNLALSQSVQITSSVHANPNPMNRALFQSVLSQSVQITYSVHANPNLMNLALS